MRLTCATVLIFLVAQSVAARADHDQLAVRLFVQCLAEIDVYHPTHNNQAHGTANLGLLEAAVTICGQTASSVCELGSETLQNQCFARASVGVDQQVNALLAALPDQIDASGFDPIFYQSALRDAYRPWSVDQAETEVQPDYARFIGESGRLFHARVARRLYEKSLLDTSE